VSRDTARPRQLGSAARDMRKARKEPLLTQIASFVELFVWLLVLKSFFLPLFIIPTGSMAETLSGAHATFTCPNCGYEYPVGFHQPEGPKVVQCPNCRQQLPTRRERPDGIRLTRQAGDRIVVHGWPFDLGGRFGPSRWDVVVFKKPNQPDVNFNKRLIGLPGETIEIIDGDVFVQGRDDDALHAAPKTRYAQQALWFPYYDHDYPPKEATQDWAAQAQGQRRRWPTFHPRWVALDDSGGWVGLETRTPRFEGGQREREDIQFVTRVGSNPPPGRVLDVYGYNSTGIQYNDVTDVRLSVDVELDAGDGYVELSISKYDDFFYARLYRDGRVTLEHGDGKSPQREPWGQAQISLPEHAVRLSLGHADYHVAVEIDRQTVLESSRQQYHVTAEEARQRAPLVKPPNWKGVAPTIRIAAERVQASLAHLLIERDVYYTSGNLRDGGASPGTGTQGHAITLNDEAYFMCGDNSPGSHDSRAWSAGDLGPHLRAAYAEGEYELGTVPADQMIGRAFFVYWPGFMPLSARGPNLLPDLGRVRWIH
jgi:signal peptidase I